MLWMRKNSLMLMIFLFITGCNGEFVPDPIDPRLPVYSEKGHNAAGALVNGKTWRAVKGSSFLHVSNELTIWKDLNDSTLHLYIDGYYKDTAFIMGTDIEFVLDTKSKNISHLRNLIDKKFSLDGNLNYGTLDDYNLSESHCKSIFGQLYIKSVRKQSNENNSYNITGTFGFTIDNDSCGRVEVKYGRFDYIVSSGDIEERYF